ncbi:MAG: 3-deoxy-D-manno-octulosonic acid transferase [Chlamydiae bacterium]|nr:3-deoxy-D-manno-octulosonic acid transferase [Chlamydiota bacterium]MBI3266483.1 3-deoxy-D-manno-octulosonic acid transferase [Chlamydiota bacterium]
MLILYNILFCISFLIASPYFLYKLISSDKWREGLPMRLGFYPFSIVRELEKRKTIWFHAASVGEVKAILPLLRKFQEEKPQYHLVLTTVTRTGNRIAKENLADSITLLYFPLDFYFSVAWAIHVIHPSLVVLAESELWANFLSQVYRKRIPVALINVRMSLRSFRKFQKARFFVTPFIEGLSLMTGPTAKEANKMMLLGAESNRVHVVGNLKYEKDDFEPLEESEKNVLREELGFSQGVLILLAGSTHSGEEEILVEIYQDLAKVFPQLYLILVPRHPERSHEVAQLLLEKGLSFQFRTKIQLQTSHHVLVVDTVGELEKIYSIADVVFIGKSLTRKGGQNFLEPARFGKPIVFGPHMENFEDMASTFTEWGGAIQVTDAALLKETLHALLNSPSERERLGAKAKEILSWHQGALEKTFNLLVKLLP